MPSGRFSSVRRIRNFFEIRKWDVKTELLMLPNADKPAPLAWPPPPPVKKRKNRRKTHLAWEQADKASEGLYARNLELIERKFPAQTPMELRVCAMVKAYVPSWKIAEMLGITERTVEGHRKNAHKKMKIPYGKQLNHYLARL